MSESLLDGRWYTTDEVAEIIGVDASTLRRWRTARPPKGPAFVPLSDRNTKYHSRDVESWLASKRVDPGKVA
ncbi:helix-turn-helix transcriptional regulator [Lentzea sp. NPDC054927]